VVCVTGQATAERVTYGSVLAEPRFRAVFGSRGVSICAETLRILALSVLVFSATGSALLSAVAFGAGFLPQALGGLLLGAVADRMPARRLMVGGYLLDAVAGAALALARLPVGWCLVLVAGVAAVTPVFTGSAARVVAGVLTGDAYVLGRSLLGMASSAAQLLGLAGGGIAVAALGPRHALLVSAGGHLLAAAWTRLGLPAPPPGDREAAGHPGRPSAIRASWRGGRELLTDRAVRRLLLAHWLPPTLITGGEAVLVPYAGDRGFPPGATGVLLAATPVGMLAGDLVVGRLLRPAVRERMVVPLVVLLGAPLPVLLARPPLALVAALLALSGSGYAYALGIQRRLLAALPHHGRGQAFALLATGLMTLQGLSPVATGALAEWLGPAATIAALGLATITTTLVMPRGVPGAVTGRVG
jgi:Major Facilitator Superfamily